MHVPAESDCTMCRPRPVLNLPTQSETGMLQTRTGNRAASFPDSESCLQTGPLPFTGTALLIILNCQTPRGWTCHLGRKATASYLVSRHIITTSPIWWCLRKFLHLDLWKLDLILTERVKLVHSKAMVSKFFPLRRNFCSCFQWLFLYCCWHVCYKEFLLKYCIFGVFGPKSQFLCCQWF